MSGGVSRSSGVIAERDDGDDGLVGGVVKTCGMMMGVGAVVWVLKSRSSCRICA